MKKIALAILASLGVATAAQASNNWYVEANAGYSKLKYADTFNKSRFVPSIAVGYDFGDWRLAADYTHFGKVSSDTINNNGYHYDGNTKIYGLGFSAIYDIQVNPVVTPYVGARVSLNHLKTTHNASWNWGTGSRSASESESDTKVGYGVFAGVQYKLAPNLSLNGAVEYNRLAHYYGDNLKQYGLKLGIRYDF